MGIVSSFSVCPPHSVTIYQVCPHPDPRLLGGRVGQEVFSLITVMIAVPLSQKVLAQSRARLPPIHPGAERPISGQTRPVPGLVGALW